MLVTMLTACGKFTCDLCGKEKNAKQYKDDFMGEKITYCKECHKELKELEKAFS